MARLLNPVSLLEKLVVFIILLVCVFIARCDDPAWGRSGLQLNMPVMPEVGEKLLFSSCLSRGD